MPHNAEPEPKRITRRRWSDNAKILIIIKKPQSAKHRPIQTPIVSPQFTFLPGNNSTQHGTGLSR